MSFVVSTYISGARGTFSGEMWILANDFTSTVPVRMFPPVYVSTVDRYPSAGKQDNRLYLCGGHTDNLVIDEDFRCLRQGIPAPFAPSVAVGAGAISQIAYQRFFDEITEERSPLSEGFAFTGDLNRAWSALATEVVNEQVVMEGLATFAGATVTGDGKANFDILRPGDRIAKATDLTKWARIRSIASANSMIIDDATIAGAGVALVAKPTSRVSHIELWLSVSGGLPRLVNRLRIGTTTYSESTATLALGEAEIDAFTAMPYGILSVTYNRRQIIAGVEGQLDTLFLSLLGFPERHNGLIFQTKYGEPIVGLLRDRKAVIVYCPESSYVLRGFTDDDYSLDELEPTIGALGHHHNVVDRKGDAFFLADDGPKIFNGGSHDAMPKRSKEWSQEVAANRLAYERGIGAYNPKDHTYQFWPRYADLSVKTDRVRGWIANGMSSPSPEGGILLPKWTSESHVLPNTDWVTYARYVVPSGATTGKFYYGSSHGRIYEEDQTGTVASHLDSFIVTGHLLFGDPGLHESEGKKLVELLLYARSEESAHEAHVWQGDEYAYPPDHLSNGLFNQADPAFQDGYQASKLVDGTVTYAAKTVHTYEINLQGRGFALAFIFRLAKDIVFIGFSVGYGPGGTDRHKYLDAGDPG